MWGVFRRFIKISIKIIILVMTASLMSVHCFMLPDGKVTNWQQIRPLSFRLDNFHSLWKERLEDARGVCCPWIFTLPKCSLKVWKPCLGWKIPSLVWLEPCTISQLTWVRLSFPFRTQVKIMLSPSWLRLIDIWLLEMPAET